jgi:hypothetical protein
MSFQMDYGAARDAGVAPALKEKIDFPPPLADL